MICERFGVFDMEIKRFVGGELANNAYIVYDGMGSKCVVIDPGFSPEIFLKFIEENDLQLKYILLTHHQWSGRARTGANRGRPGRCARS